MKHSKGQVLVEAIISLLVVKVVIVALFALIVISASHFWMKFALYEGLICLAEDRVRPFCMGLTNRRIQTGLRFAKIHSLILNQNDKSLDGRIDLRVPFLPSIHTSLRIPNPSKTVRKVQ